jgi:hypothetical protein
MDLQIFSISNSLPSCLRLALTFQILCCVAYLCVRLGSFSVYEGEETEEEDAARGETQEEDVETKTPAIYTRRRSEAIEE